MPVETDTRRILDELEKVLASTAFANAGRSGRLLRFLVEETVSGRGGLKESVLALKVLGRPPGFDPRTDPIARVEVSRLRVRLELFYASEGRADEVRIVLPRGSYVPMFETVEPGGLAAATPASSPRARAPKRIWAAAVVTFFAGLWAGSFQRPSKPGVESLSMLPPTGATLVSFAVSPNGRMVAMAAAAQGMSRLYIRSLDSFDVRALPDTQFASYPFWSPDAKSVGFFTHDKLKVVDVAGGASRTICDAPLGRGGTWNVRGDILFAPGALGPLFRVSSRGGKPQRVTSLNTSYGETGHRWPQFLPDGRRFVFFAVGENPERSALNIGDLNSNESRFLLQAGSQGIPLIDGHRGYLLFERDDVLHAQAIDVESAVVSGEPFVVADRVRFDPLTRYSWFSASVSGLLAYVVGSPFNQELVWVDRTGGEVDRIAEPGDYISMRISPLGSHAVLSRTDPRSGWPGVWNLDLPRGAMYPVGPPTVDWFPVWSANGAAVLFSSASSKGEAAMTFKIAVAAGGNPTPLRVINGPAFPSDWSPDGSWLAYTGYSSAKGAGVWLAPVSRGEIGIPSAFIDSEHNEGGAVFSPAPERREPSWLAYTSDESGRDEVYVQSFPKPGTKIKISLTGGSRPLWRHDGGELYFLDPRGLLMVARVQDARSMAIDQPRKLFRIDTPPPDKPPYALNYATRDGSRFLVRSARIEDDNRSIAIVTHWTPVHR